MFSIFRQHTLKCNNCLKTLAELDLSGEKQNKCPFCGAVDSCEPIEAGN